MTKPEFEYGSYAQDALATEKHTGIVGAYYGSRNIATFKALGRRRVVIARFCSVSWFLARPSWRAFFIALVLCSDK